MTDFDFTENWVTILCVTLLILGLIVSVITANAFISYTFIFLSGMLSGRVVYDISRKKHDMAWLYLVIFFFLVGYILGTYTKPQINRVVIIALFLLANIIAYEIFDKKIIKPLVFDD